MFLKTTNRFALPSIGAALLFAIAGLAQDPPPAAKVPEKAFALRTTAGYYLTAENGGGGMVNTDRMELGPWETFMVVQTAPGVFAFRTEDGHYLTDLMGGRRGNRQTRGGLGATKNTTDETTQFKIMIVNPQGPVVALITSAGKYVTAENSGGLKSRSTRAMATDRTEIGDWEQFTLVDVEAENKRKSGN